RRVYIYPTPSGSQIYTSRQSGTIDCVATVGRPTPPTSGTPTRTLLPGMPTSASESAYDFFFADANTLYVADDTNSTSFAGGLQKWTFNGSVWSRVYNLQVVPAGVPRGIKSLAGTVDPNGNVTLFGSTAELSGA